MGNCPHQPTFELRGRGANAVMEQHHLEQDGTLILHGNRMMDGNLRSAAGSQKCCLMKGLFVFKDHQTRLTCSSSVNSTDEKLDAGLHSNSPSEENIYCLISFCYVFHRHFLWIIFFIEGKCDCLSLPRPCNNLAW